MSKPVESASSSLKDTTVLIPWWIRFCRWLWKISVFFGFSVVLSLVVSVFATWLTSPGGVFPASSPAEWLIVKWPLALLVGGSFLLLALLTGVLSRWPTQTVLTYSPAQQNRVRMLKRLHHSYDDILAQSLQGVAWIELGLARQLEAVQNAATLLFRPSNGAEKLLSPGTPITQVYEDASHELLILGEPGAGKSTLLLQLAQRLVELAEQDDTQLLPIFLPLSSWAVRRPKLKDWLAEQVAETYDIPEQLARRWVQDEQLLPLLDGLDEMEEEARPACIVAINAYHHTNPGAIVVCSRSAEYEKASKHQRLNLQSAVMVQPLTPKQVNTYLTQVGKQLEALRRALNKNNALQELASTPLMLSVLMLTYQGLPVRSLFQRGAELLQQVWNEYTQRMVERKGDVARYPLNQTRQWLHWQARQMNEHNQTVFYLEHLQPDWLPTGQQLSYDWLGIRVPGILIGILASITTTLLLISIRYDGIGFVLQMGVLGGFLGGLFSEAVIADKVRQPVQNNPHQAVRHVIIKRTATSTLVGLLYGLCFGLNLDPQYFGLRNWLWVGSISGFVIGFSCWLLLTLVPRFSARDIQISPGKTHFSLGLRKVMHAWHGQRALLVAVVFGGDVAIIGLAQYLYYGSSYRNIDIIYSLGDGLIVGLVLGIISVLISLIFEVQKEDVNLTERLRWTWSSLLRSLFSPRHFRMTMLFASIILVVAGLISGLTHGLSRLLDYELLSGLYEGLLFGLGYGLNYALCFGLSYWILIGLYEGISHENVEDKDRRVFNQGIRRSFRNSLIMGCISAVVIGVTGVLCYGLYKGLNAAVGLRVSNGLTLVDKVDLSNGLRNALLAAQGFGKQYGWVLVVSGGLLVWASYGGLAILRHVLLRLLLWRTHTFPLKAAPFLEDAKTRILLRRVGGGYSFMHRLLLDYFASLDKKDS